MPTEEMSCCRWSLLNGCICIYICICICIYICILRYIWCLQKRFFVADDPYWMYVYVYTYVYVYVYTYVYIDIYIYIWCLQKKFFVDTIPIKELLCSDKKKVPRLTKRVPVDMKASLQKRPINMKRDPQKRPPWFEEEESTTSIGHCGSTYFCKRSTIGLLCLTEETYKRDQTPTKETCKDANDPTKETCKCGKRSTEETPCVWQKRVPSR